MPARRDIPSRSARPPRAAAPTSTATGSSSTTRPPSATPGSATSPGPPRSRPTRPTIEAAQWLDLGGEPGARRPLGEHPGAVRRPAPAARCPASPSRRSTCAPRPSTWPGPSTRRPQAADVGAVILELARSEQTYTFQRPIDYATAVLAGAIAAGWRGPVFIQGDHYQFNAKKYAADPEAMTEEIRRACRLAIDAGYRNIDIDSSTLVDLSKPNVDEEQRENYTRAAELTALIRTLETDGVTISVGGEIGEVGTQNSTVAELRAYLDGYRRELDARAPGRHGHLEGQRPDRHVARRRAAARRRRGRGQARLRGAPRARRGRPRRTGWPAPSSTARRPCPTSCSTASRRSRPPRSTSRPASRTRSTSTRPSRRRSTARSRPGASRTRPTSARPARPTSSSSTRPARRRSGRSSASSGTSRRRTRSWRPSGARSRTCSRELGVNDSRAMVDRYVHAGRGPSADPGRPARGRRRRLSRGRRPATADLADPRDALRGSVARNRR